LSTQTLNKQARFNELKQLYIAYSKDKNLVNLDWQEFFDDLAPEASLFLKEFNINNDDNSFNATNTNITLDSNSRSATLDSIRALMLIRAYRVRGHLKANLDPLKLTQASDHPELKPESYGFEEKDMDRLIFIDNVLGIESATLREIIANLEATYCGTIGVQFMHIQDPEQKAWIQKTLENVLNQPDFTDMGKKAILERLVAAVIFERFLD
jgi:2-oxoglutarate dehydrogenase E1 component